VFCVCVDGEKQKAELSNRPTWGTAQKTLTPFKGCLGRHKMGRHKKNGAVWLCVWTGRSELAEEVPRATQERAQKTLTPFKRVSFGAAQKTEKTNGVFGRKKVTRKKKKGRQNNNKQTNKQTKKVLKRGRCNKITRHRLVSDPWRDLI